MSDVISEMLRAMRVSGAVVLHQHYRRPWAIDIPPSARLAACLGESAHNHVVPFHFVERGGFMLRTAGGPDRRIGAGDIVVCFGGGAHRMEEGTPATAWRLPDLLNGNGPPDAPAECEGGEDVTRILCGVFVLRETRMNPLFSALPTVVHFPLRDASDASWLGALGGALIRERAGRDAASAFMVAKLLELLCAEAVRQCMAELPVGHQGLLRGLADGAVSRALSAFHADPREPWTVDRLADAAGISRSRFAARFQAALGQGPMTYVTRWRMNMAGRMLTHDGLRAEEVAYRVGYESAAAFNRAFRKHMGHAPGRWRRDVISEDFGREDPRPQDEIRTNVA